MAETADPQLPEPFEGDGELAAVPAGKLVETVYAALAELASRSAPESGVASVEIAERLAAGLDLGEVALAGLVQRADQTGEPLSLRYAGTRGWLKTALGMRTGRADERLTVARQLPRLPAVTRQLRAGELSFGYASTICDAVARLDDTDCGKAEEILLGAADEGLSPTKVAKLGTRIRDVIAAQRRPRDRTRGRSPRRALMVAGLPVAGRRRRGPRLVHSRPARPGDRPAWSPHRTVRA